MEINISTKFNIGDEVYTIKKVKDTKVIKEICPICEGVGNFIHNGHKIFCANCYGHGYHETDRKEITRHMVGDHGKVSSMRLQIPGLNTEKPAHDADVMYLRYKVGGRFFPEYLVFVTEQEAIEACKELDKGYIWHDMKELPVEMFSLVLMLADGREIGEYGNIDWNGACFYEYTDEGIGSPLRDFDIIKWRYKNTEE